ncbi:molybdenum cofactor sulfurase-like [Gossypium australe]|uniref:Molybdenum cofactor sulfurase-like n=1 Tax=Gossypium australe TaxID=47621 RepID=A0A5B6W737_9ROSI|nr:molybdenum cofactor sulfurase-like [Gossypium australe]
MVLSTNSRRGSLIYPFSPFVVKICTAPVGHGIHLHLLKTIFGRISGKAPASITAGRRRARRPEIKKRRTARSVAAMRRDSRYPRTDCGATKVRAKTFYAEKEKVNVVDKLRKKIMKKGGLFVIPLQSNVTGSRYSYTWMSLVHENGWHVLLDATALGVKEIMLSFLQHPHSETGIHAVKIYGPKVMFDRGLTVAFNVFDWKEERIDPTLVQKLTNRNNISLCIRCLQDIWFSVKHKEMKEKDEFQPGIDVIATIGFLTSFEDI